MAAGPGSGRPGAFKVKPEFDSTTVGSHSGWQRRGLGGC